MLRLPLLLALAASASAAVGPVQHGATDAGFLAALPVLQGLFSNVPGPTAGPSFGVPLLDPFGFSGSGHVRIWFLSAESSAPNVLGFVPGEPGDMTGAETIFPTATGLALGDYVDVMTNGGITPFVLSGANTLWAGTPSLTGGNNLEFSQPLIDGYFTGPASHFYALAVEDQLNGDNDWNDLRVAFEFDPHVIAAPEPATWALMLGFAAVAAWAWRRRAALA